MRILDNLKENLQSSEPSTVESILLGTLSVALVVGVIYLYSRWMQADKNDKRESKKIFRYGCALFLLMVAIMVVLVVAI